jgi:hypothetical protein
MWYFENNLNYIKVQENLKSEYYKKWLESLPIDWKRKPSRHWPARKQLSKDYEVYEPH